MSGGDAGAASSGAGDAGVVWTGRRFHALSVFELDRIFAARQQVFAVEQRCAFVDADGCDERGFHLAAWSTAQREPLAYARILDPGVKADGPSIGRVLTTAPARGRGLGREVVRRSVAQARAAWPGRAVHISAQTRLLVFYAGFGFEPVGASYLEDGLSHTEMRLAAAAG